MSVPLIVILSVVGLLLFIMLVLEVYSHIRYKRSLMATIAELYLKITEKKSKNKRNSFNLHHFFKKEDGKVACPKRYAKIVKMDEYDAFGIQTFVFTGSKNNNVGVIYLHGAGYVRQPRPQHWRFVSRLAKKTGSTVIFPIYPKAPKHNYKESYNKLTNLYLQTKKHFNKVVLMGDSSGGGLALGLSEDFLKNGISQPDELILLSPWLDITFENSQILKYEKVDPIVCISNDRIFGKSWAAGTDLKDYKVSPIYGNVVGLKSVTLFVGTREALYPDVKILEEILKDSKVKVKTFIGRGLNHVFPIFPIPEAKKAMNNIAKIILN